MLERDEVSVSRYAFLKGRLVVNTSLRKVGVGLFLVGLCGLTYVAVTLVLVGIPTVGGDSPGDVAAKLYKEQANAPVGRHGSKDRCNTASDAAAAYLKEANSEQYNNYKKISDYECKNADKAQEVLDEAEKNFGDLENSMEDFIGL